MRSRSSGGRTRWWVLLLVAALVAAAAWVGLAGRTPDGESVGDATDTPRVGPEASPAAAAAEAREATTTPSLSPDLVARLLAGPRQPTDTQSQVARDFHALYDRWHEARYEALFAAPSVAQRDRLEERIEWPHGRLGACGPAEPMHVQDSDNARFTHTCEHGRLEAGFKLDPTSQRISGLMLGARNVAPEPVVQEVALRVVALMQAWDLALFRRTFGERYEPDRVRTFLAEVRANRGTCRLGAPDLVSPRGGLFALHCEHAERTLKVELDDTDRVSQYAIFAAAEP